MAVSRARVRQPITRRRYLAITAITFVALVGLWAAVTGGGLVSKLFLPSPGAVLERLLEQARSGQLFEDISLSVYRITLGYLIATAMALLLGPLMGMSQRVEAMIEPLVDFIRYMPVVAFVPLTILWIGTGDAQKFLIIWMGTFFQQVLMVADAVRQVPQPMIHLGETLGMGRVAILTRIAFPAAWPRIWDALRVTLGWAWTWLVVAELVAARGGMGYRITVAQRYFATDTIIGYVIVLGLLGLIFDQAMRAAGRAMFRYQRSR
ncbi:MAG: ABC transporter permease [Propionibacteriaceae bacterium]|jgi:NitT/TauT family transport system permease protein|nr:ABC transporter permease [Propionibacteriaceae bacterium]